MRLHPRTVAGDLLLAAALAVTMLVELTRSDKADTAVTPLAVVLIAAASAAPVLLRRSHPAVALVVGMVLLYAVMATVDIYQTVPFPTMVAGYQLALTAPRRTSVIAALALVPPVVVAIGLFGHSDTLFSSFEVPKNLVFVAAPFLLGTVVRERRVAHDALVARAETAERTREQEALRRVGEERLRIARDVHDLVAHAMVAINVQAGVGAHLLDRDPEQARRTLLEIKKASGEALTDLRATLGALRTADDELTAPVLPTQGLGEELDELAAGVRAAGVEVVLDVDPGAARVPSAVAATGYRIVQEALTNVVRHAHGSRAVVRVRPEATRLVVEVTDTGGAPSTAPGSGNGVRGMRERAQAAGGTLDAGPHEGGWRVHASLPLVTPLVAVS